MLNDDMWVGLANPDLNSCTSGSSNECDNKFRWIDDDFSAAAPLEGKVEADGDGTCFAMTNGNTVRDQSCQKVTKFACEFSCVNGTFSFSNTRGKKQIILVENLISPKDFTEY